MVQACDIAFVGADRGTSILLVGADSVRRERTAEALARASTGTGQTLKPALGSCSLQIGTDGEHRYSPQGGGSGLATRALYSCHAGPVAYVAFDRHPLPHMRLLHLARRPPQWLRVALAGLLLAFAVNSIASVTHRHDAAPSSATHSLSCGYCLSFNGLVDAPRHDHVPLDVTQETFYLSADVEGSFVARPSTSARPRAPPVL